MRGGGPQIPDAANSARWDLTIKSRLSPCLRKIRDRLFGANDEHNRYRGDEAIATAKAGLSTKGGGE